MPQYLRDFKRKEITGRTKLSAYAFDMFKNNKVFGEGLNTYNYYIKNRGYRVKTKWNPTGVWNYNAHNIYYQVLGESGLIGIALFIEFIVYNMYHTIKLILKMGKKNNEDKRFLLFSLYIQLLIVTYGITGNPLYSPYQFIFYIIAINILNKLRRNEFESRKNLVKEYNDNYDR